MIAIDRTSGQVLRTPVRNHFFYGKLMDVYQFELETGYFNAKRRLLNRLVSGYGVVCGLNVEPGPDGRHVVIAPGVAIDKWGREIIVPERTAPIAIPPHLLPPETPADGKPPGYQGDRDTEEPTVLQVLLCYHECESDPTPVLGGDCGTADECAAGSIRERYHVIFKEGPAPPIKLECRVPDLFYSGKLDYDALVRFVSESCPSAAADPCIPLANVQVTGDGHECDPEHIDITIRPIVYSNDLLLEILLSLLAEGRDEPRRTK